MDRVNLDSFDLEILSELDLNCRASSVELASRLNRSRQTLDYRVARLQEWGVLENFHTTINYSQIGFRLYKIFLRMRNLPERKADLHEYLFQLGSVYWIGSSSGAWDLLIGLFYRSEEQLAAVSNELVSRFEDLIVAREGQLIVGIQQFPKNYFTNECRPSRELFGPVKQKDLDDLDYQLLAELIKDARIPLVRLSDSLGVSLVAIQRRIKRLEDLGIIVQYRIGVNLAALGLKLYKIVFNLWSYGDKEQLEFFSYISSRPEIQYFVRNVWSVELEVISASYEHVQQLVDDVRTRFPRLSTAVEILLLETDEWTPALTNALKRSSG